MQAYHDFSLTHALEHGIVWKGPSEWSFWGVGGGQGKRKVRKRELMRKQEGKYPLLYEEVMK